MKKIFSISLAFFIFLSGMNLTLASHTCGGKVAAVKWSLTGKKATCGMETSQTSCPSHRKIASNCCQNKTVVYEVDHNYNPSSFQIKEVTKKVLQIIYLPVNLLSSLSAPTVALHTGVSPPDKLLTSAVSLVSICVFRI